jgi:endonuclease/exonuclease/phosphatase family metal-dependent hydrolase
MRVLTWNIQFGKGCDGKIDLQRIADRIRTLGEPEVICLQEVARFVPSLGAAADRDQLSILSDLFPRHEPVYGPAVDYSRGALGPRQQFGNLLLSRLPVLQVIHHSLPQPPDPAVKQMPRQAIEAVLDADGTPFRVVTTHFEYGSETQRLAQASYLRTVQADVERNNAARSSGERDGLYRHALRPDACLLCGDFNALPDDKVYSALASPIGNGATKATAPCRDAWRLLRGAQGHAPTCGAYDREQWPEGGHCRDYFFVSRAAESSLTEIFVDQETDASDHQPVLLTFDPAHLSSTVP